MQLTLKLLNAGRTPAGAFNLAQLKVLGVDLPGHGQWPAKGWLHRLCGKEVSPATYETFLALATATVAERRAMFSEERHSERVERWRYRQAKKHAQQLPLL